MTDKAQAPLALSNLLSRGYSMAEARKKLGLDKKPEAPAAAPESKKPVVKTNPAITPPAKADSGEALL
jgi:hypothetical protein